MLLIVSPAKALDYETPLAPAVAQLATEPLFVDQASALITVLQKKKPAQVARLMDLSAALAQLNVDRYAAWAPAHDDSNSRPAVLAFDGDVYGGMQAKTFNAKQLAWVQQHLVILSGLYGALRPLDRLQPYRLEMGTALSTRRGKDLYAFWGERVAAYLNQRLAEQHAAPPGAPAQAAPKPRTTRASDSEPGAEPILVNLASIEYARVALRKSLRAQVIDCVFEDWKDGRYKIISFFAKRARGLMVRHLALQAATSPEAMRSFDADGYAWDAAQSTPERWVFRRRVQPA
jgi:uncharacterized protein